MTRLCDRRMLAPERIAKACSPASAGFFCGASGFAQAVASGIHPSDASLRSDDESGEGGTPPRVAGFSVWRAATSTDFRKAGRRLDRLNCAVGDHVSV